MRITSGNDAHSFTRRISAGEPITVFGDGTEARDYTYVDDIVTGIVAALDWTETAPPGVEVFNLGGNEPVALAPMIAEISAALQIEPRIERAGRQPGDARLTSADLATSGRVLGYRPTTAFPDGIGRFLAWFQETHARQ